MREIDATSTNEIASSDSSDVSAAISQSTLLCPSDPMQDSLARDPERKPFQSRPMSNEQCRRWLRGQCEKGSSCNYIHEEVGRSEKDSVSFLPLTSTNDPVVDFDFYSALFVWK